MCVLVEMLTGRQPWCYQEEVSLQCIIYTVSDPAIYKITVISTFLTYVKLSCFMLLIDSLGLC